MLSKHLRKAEEFLESGGPESLQCAALHLRLAIEHHAYEKLAYYSKRYGTKTLFKYWQPNKAMKVLCQLEPRSDQSYVLSIAEEGEDGKPPGDFKPIGRHEALTARWIAKNYNKLGKFLHLEPQSLHASDVPVSFLVEVATELNRVKTGNLLGNIAQTVTIECFICGEQVTYCVDAAPGLDEVLCPSPTCNACYTPEESEDGWGFRLKAVNFKCPDCGKVKPVLENELRFNARIRCSGCQASFVIVGNEWKLAKEPS